MKIKKKYKVLFLCVIVCAGIMWGKWQIDEYRKNLKLYNAIESGDAASGIEAVEEGAGKDSFNSFLLVMESLSGKDDRNPVYADTILRNDNEIAGYLIQSGANPNYKDKDGISLLMLAAKMGNLDFCKLLIENGADPGYKRKGASALDYAITSEDITDAEKQQQLAEYLYKAGVPVTTVTKRFLKRGYGFEGEVSKSWEKMTQWAIEKGIVEEADLSQKQQYFYKIAAGENIDLKELQKKYDVRDLYHVSGENIAMTAAKNGHIEMLKWAAAKGASLKEEDVHGDNILVLAAGTDNLETLEYLIEKLKPSGEEIYDCICEAMECAPQSTILYLAKQIDAFSDKSAVESTETILNVAAEYRRMDLVRYLTEKGMKPDGVTLEYAVYNSDMEMAEYILEQGVGVDQTESYGGGSRSQSALAIAIPKGDLEMTEFLQEKGAKSRDAKETLENSESKRIREICSKIQW